MGAVMDVPLFGMAQEASTSDDYYTPPMVFDLLGLRFDLDVCAPPDGCPWIPADRFYTMADDGLSSPWAGRVWMNPPFSKPAPWVRKFIEHGHGICLVPNSKSRWHIDLWEAADGIAVPNRGYFDFVGGAIFMPVMFAAFGEKCVEALHRVGTVH